jgi:DNA-binding NtrC family response regulator
MVKENRFREDLYFRLNVVTVILPPLRERLEDLPLLARHFLTRYSVKYNRSIPALTPEDETRLFEYHWPGNIRELQNVIERAMILYNGEDPLIDLPTEGGFNARQFFGDLPSMDEMQRRYIRYAIAKTGGKIGGPAGAAEMLGMKRTTLQKRMKKLNLIVNRQ